MFLQWSIVIFYDIVRDVLTARRNEKKSNRGSMRSIELFAGAGGLGLGVAAAGFKNTATVEWDRWCCETLRENKARGLDQVADWAIQQGDVRDLDYRQYEGKVDLVTGGPPCQPFSVGGKHRGNDDARDMFPAAVSVVRQTKPKAFIFENVKGLTRATFTSYFEYIKLQLTFPGLRRRKEEDWTAHLARLEDHQTRGRYRGLKYNVVARVLNAANYGVPQKRERVFLVGFRDEPGLEGWHFPEGQYSKEALLWSQATGEYWDRLEVRKKDRIIPREADRVRHPPNSQPWRTVREAIGDLPDPECHPRKSSGWLNHKFQPGARSYPGHTGSPLDEPAKTLKAGVHGVPGGENMLRRPDGSIRYFTVRESARLQTFPDDFVFHGAWSETMRQLGNAVPVDLAAIIAGDVRRHLNKVKG